jgi:hypothetical protein
MKSGKWWKDGVQFECQASGKCCTSRGEFGYVYLTPEDRQRFADYMKIEVSEFEKKYCEKSGGIWHLKEIKERPDCQFLKFNKCSVYEARPTQCRTWPFWPEMMGAKAWAEGVVSYCPGVNKGRVIPAEEIEATLKEQIDSEKQYGK